ncbi:MAG: efflux RND transporter periplasmic adaptor subunit [Bacteroides sp.]|nr:efflux RND transporter periplasmic adaptor subunit [Bacteroides sp.]MBD5378042.1 efflux RND transporter periplasmic adaptor subunit [Bacteroides sp.]
MKKFMKRAMWVLVALVFVGTFVYLFKNSQPKEVKFASVTPATGTIERSTVLTGSIEPRDEIEIKPQISGIISEINVEAGQMVSEGDVIARIKVIPDESQLASAQSSVNTAEIALSDAETRHNRNTMLYNRKVIARETYEQTLTEVERCRAELRAARNALAIIRDGVSPDNASGSNTLVRATTSGLVLDVPVKVGASVIQANTMNDGTTIATIADMSRLIFKGTVDETEVGNLAIGQHMNITIGAIPDLQLEGDIEYISPKSASGTSGANTFEIKAAIVVPDNTQIRAGYSANASVTLLKAENVLTVPEGVIEFSGDSTFVYVLTDSAAAKYDRRPVVTGLSDGINIEIKSGIDKNVRLRGAEIKEGE